MKKNNMIIILIIGIWVFSSSPVPGLTEQANSRIISFLKDPLNHLRFKLKKGQSNSGGFRSDLPLFKPKSKGFYYQYMLFPTPADIGEGRRFAGLRIIVYQPGNRILAYHNAAEILIGIKSSYPDPDLERANLVGLTEKEIIDRFGKPSARKGVCLIYFNQNNILCLNVNGEKKIKWFKYYKLNKPVRESEIPLSIYASY